MFRFFSQPAARFVATEATVYADRILGSGAAAIAGRHFSSNAAQQVPDRNDRPKWGETLISAVMKEKAESGAPTAGLFACGPNDTVFEAVRKMATANVGSIVIMSDQSKSANAVLGLLTERDYMRKVVIQGKSSKDLLCSSIMTPTQTLVTLTPSDSVLMAMKTMEENNVRHIPIIDGSTFMGMLSIKDVVGTMVNEHTAEVESMAEYIGGSY